MPQHPGKDLRTACASFTPAQWAYVTAKALAVVGEPSTAKALVKLMQDTGAEEYVDITDDTNTARERAQFAKLRKAKLILFGPVTTYGAKSAKVNWREVGKLVGEVRCAPILRGGYGMRAMF